YVAVGSHCTCEDLFVVSSGQLEFPLLSHTIRWSESEVDVNVGQLLGLFHAATLVPVLGSGRSSTAHASERDLLFNDRQAFGVNVIARVVDLLLDLVPVIIGPTRCEGSCCGERSRGREDGPSGHGRRHNRFLSFGSLMGRRRA